MQNVNQQELERAIRAFVEKTKTEYPGTLCALLQPNFVECDAAEQTLIMSYPAQSWEANTRGRMQGGAIAALLDFTGGVLAAGSSGGTVLTVSMQVSYLRPGPTEGTVLVKARMTKTGRTMLHAFTECWSESAPGKLIATANVVYISA